MPLDDILLRTHRNTILETIARVGLPAEAFAWSVTPETPPNIPAAQLTHTETGHYCRIRHAIGAHYQIQFTPGQTEPMEFQHGLAAERMLWWVGRWLLSLRREIEAPDLWAEVAKVKELGRAARGKGPDRKFTAKERARIEKKLDELHCYLVRVHHLEGERDAEVRSQIAFLVDAAKVQTRDAWMYMFLGVILSVILSAAVPPAAIQEFLRYVTGLVVGPGGLLPGK